MNSCVNVRLMQARTDKQVHTEETAQAKQQSAVRFYLVFILQFTFQLIAVAEANSFFENQSLPI